MKLTQELLLRIANGSPAVPGWPDDGGEDRSLAQYHPLIKEIKSLPVNVEREDGWEYGETFFCFLLHGRQSDGSSGGRGLYVAVSRFAPIGIYGEANSPTSDNAYRVSSPDWIQIAENVETLMKSHEVYMPTIDELKAPITFPLPQIFSDNANLGKSIVFDILFNDLY